MNIKKGSTTILKTAIFLFAMLILFGLLYFPQVEGRNINADQFTIYFKDPFLAYVYFSSIPFFIGSYQTIKLLGNIEQNRTFSKSTSNILRTIKLSAYTLSGLMALAMPFLIMFAQDDDSPGVVLIGIIAVFVTLVIGTGSGLFEKQIIKKIGKKR